MDSKFPKVDKTLAAAVVIAATVGFLLGGQVQNNPFKPQKERPFLKFLAKVARLGLWVTAFADPPPASVNYALQRHPSNDYVSHREGW